MSGEVAARLGEADLRELARIIRGIHARAAAAEPAAEPAADGGGDA